MSNELNPVSGNSLDKSCGESISSNCVQYCGPAIPGINICKGSSITQVITQLGNSIGDIPNTLDFGCLWQANVYTCPTGWTLVPGTATTAPYCTNGCPPGSVPSGAACVACPSFNPCPPPAPVYGPNPIPKPATLTAVLQLLINALQPLCTCNPCLSITKNTTATSGCPPGTIC